MTFLSAVLSAVALAKVEAFLTTIALASVVPQVGVVRHRIVITFSVVEALSSDRTVGQPQPRGRTTEVMRLRLNLVAG